MKTDKCVVKFCIVCGKRIPNSSTRKTLCSDKCSLRRKELKRCGKPAPYEHCAEPPIQANTLGGINAAARAA